MVNTSLDWKVEKVQLYDKRGETPFYAIKREDNGKHLGIVGKKYKIVQNSYIQELCEKICGLNGYEVLHSLAIQGGKKTLISLKTGKVRIGDDDIISQITFLNSFDRSSGVSLSFGDLTIRCANEFYKIVKNSDYSFSHSQMVEFNLNSIIQNIAKLNIKQKEHYNNLERFVSTPLSKDLAVKKINKLLDIQVSKSEDEFDFTKVSTRRKNQFLSIMDCYEKESVHLHETVYTLFNTITRYTTHVIDNSAIGIGLHLNNTAYNMCCSL